MTIPILIILILVFIVILFGVNIYILRLYRHPDDKGWSNVLYCKVLVVLGLTLSQAQAFMVSLDVSNSSSPLSLDGIKMIDFWAFLYIIILLMVSVFLPFALFFYETDEQHSMIRRLCGAFCYTIGAIGISSLLLFVTWHFFKWTDLPYTEVSLKIGKTSDRSNIQPFDPTQTSEVIHFEASLAVYIMGILSFFGWIFVIIFGGVGLFALPIDLINEYRHRPRPRRAKQMRKGKDALVSAIKSLISESQNIAASDMENKKNVEGKFLARMKESRHISNQLTKFKIKYFAIEEQYRIFNEELKYADMNPVIPYLKLILGFIFLTTSILWIIQIIFGNLAKAYFDSSKPLIPFLNQLLTGLENKNAGFLSTFIFAYFCLYMIWSVQKGNIKFGIRIPFCCRFHPMVQNQTWMNSFLFNVILLLIASVGVIQLCIACFPIYTRNTDIYTIFGNTVKYMTFYKFFYDKNAFPIAFIVWTFIALIYMLITINKKPSYLKQIQMIRQQKQMAKRERDQEQPNSQNRLRND